MSQRTSQRFNVRTLAVLLGTAATTIGAAAVAGGASLHGNALAVRTPLFVQIADPKSMAPATFTAGTLKIEQPWTRATPNGAKVAGGFLRITNTGNTADRLIGGSFTGASTVEVHEMAMEGSTMKMRKLETGIALPPGQTIELKPGGLHMMFIGLAGDVKEGAPVKGTLQFEKAGTVTIDYSVTPIGGQKAGGAHTHH
jgi:periplasmic copper chaperone A